MKYYTTVIWPFFITLFALATSAFKEPSKYEKFILHFLKFSHQVSMKNIVKELFSIKSTVMTKTAKEFNISGWLFFTLVAKSKVPIHML